MACDCEQCVAPVAESIDEAGGSCNIREFIAKNRNRTLIVVGVIVCLVALRAALPFLLKDFANRRLHDLNGYTGHVDAIDVALWRGAYDLQKLVIAKKGATKNEPFCDIEHLSLSIQWRALFKGSIVGEANFDRPQLNLVQSENSKDSQLGNDNDWGKTLKKLFPFKFNEINVHRGTVRFRAPGIETHDALTLQNIEASITNLTNVVNQQSAAFAHFELHGQIFGNAPLTVKGSTNPYADSPTFEVDATLESVRLPQLDAWLQAYAGVNAERGSFSMYSSLAAAEHKFKGYVKPILHDVHIVSIKEQNATPIQKIWAALVQGVATLLKNQTKDQLATKIPISGNIDDPDTGVFVAIVNVLRNAFIAAFSQSLDQSLHLQDVTADKAS
ncbi:MAG TPA: DUF748 domain-containing protein [Spongiibacteraceae bacterium]|nr:DUF748 domain-containing protein [Spongiibacteraceae bacterium]